MAGSLIVCAITLGACKSHMRPSWGEYALSLAQTAATRSEDPYYKVGACALSADNKVLGLGYNGYHFSEAGNVNY